MLEPFNKGAEGFTQFEFPVKGDRVLKKRRKIGGKLLKKVYKLSAGRSLKEKVI